MKNGAKQKLRFLLCELTHCAGSAMGREATPQARATGVRRIQTKLRGSFVPTSGLATGEPETCQGSSGPLARRTGRPRRVCPGLPSAARERSAGRRTPGFDARQPWRTPCGSPTAVQFRFRRICRAQCERVAKEVASQKARDGLFQLLLDTVGMAHQCERVLRRLCVFQPVFDLVSGHGAVTCVVVCSGFLYPAHDRTANLH